MASAVKRVLVFLVPMVMLSTISPQADELPDGLSLQNAVALALQKSTDIRRAEEGLASAEAAWRIASIGSGFSVSADSSYSSEVDGGTSAGLSGMWTYSGTSGLETQASLTPFSLGDRKSELSLSLKQPLSRGKGAFSEKATALADADSLKFIRENELFTARQSVVYDVIAAYFDAVVAREGIKIQERALAIAQEAADGATRRAEEGLVAEIEVSRASIRVARTKDELNRKVQSFRNAMDKLMIVLGSGLGREPLLTTAMPQIEEAFPDLSRSIAMAASASSVLKIYDQRLKDSARDLDNASDQLRPSLDAVLTYNTETSDTLNMDDGSLTAGLRFVMPLDKRILSEQRVSTQRSLQLLKEVKAFEAEQVTANVRNAYRARESALNSLNILGQNLETAKDNLRLAQRMVEEGLSSNRDILDAQEALVTVESGLLSARLSYYLAGVNLKRAMGEDLVKTVLQ